MSVPRNYGELVTLGIRKGWIKPVPDNKGHVVKTNRRAGLAFAYVRWFASRHKRFTYHQLCPPFEPVTAYGYCDKMAKYAMGLVRLRAGKKGSSGVTPIYAAQTKVNKW